MTAQTGDGCDRPPGCVTGMPRRTSEPLSFVDHQEVDARPHCLVGELRALDQHLQRDHRPSMKVEGIEV